MNKMDNYKIRKRKGKKLPKTPEKYLCSNDQKLILDFINSKRSESIKKHHFQHLFYFNNYIFKNYPNRKSIFEVLPEEFRNYFIHINKKQLSRETKIKYRQSLSNFIKFIEMPKLIMYISSKLNYSLIFDKDFYKFTNSSKKMPENEMSKNDVLKILEFFKGRNFRDYIAFSILAYTGMRPAALLNIISENIDFENRIITTIGKPTIKNDSGDVIYFFPKFISNDLKSFILEIKNLHPRRKTIFSITRKNLAKQLKKYRLNDYHLTQFRDTLNTLRFELGLEPDLRKKLLNQSVKDVNTNHYLKKYRDLVNLRNLYDEFFPYSSFNHYF